MSNTKNRSLARRINILKKGTISLHCKGGMAMDDPDIQRLFADGHMKLIRDFWRGAYGYRIGHTKATITDSGRAFFARHIKLVDHTPRFHNRIDGRIELRHPYWIGRKK